MASHFVIVFRGERLLAIQPKLNLGYRQFSKKLNITLMKLLQLLHELWLISIEAQQIIDGLSFGYSGIA